jgi:hypothetical protein
MYGMGSLHYDNETVVLSAPDILSACTGDVLRVAHITTVDAWDSCWHLGHRPAVATLCA